MEQENVVICEIPVTGRIRDLRVTDAGADIEFESGPVSIQDYHDQDCCEQVYADWEQLSLYRDRILNDGPYTDLTIKAVPGIGILLVFNQYYACPSPKVLVPCYNCQNGYYSSHLSIIVICDGETSEYDISENVEDNLE